MSLPEFEPVKKFVRAGAGAGKTWNLTREVVKFALDFQSSQGRWPKVVLTTFTRKATQELKERMLIYCLQEKREALEFVSSSSFLNISTMHGLMALFLSRYGNRLGFSTQLDIVDERQGKFWKKQVLKQMIEEQKVPPSLGSFNLNRLLSYLNQYEGIYWQKEVGPIGNVDEMKALGQEVAFEMADALDPFVALAQQEVQGEAWEDYFSVLNDLSDELRSPKDLKEKSSLILNYLEQAKKVKPRASKAKGVTGLGKELTSQWTRWTEKLNKWLLDEDQSESLWEKRISFLKEFDQFAKEFFDLLLKKKKQEGAIETNDLEYLALHLIEKDQKVQRGFSESVDGWFVDEFQDTSPLQMKILEKMIGETSCYMVGDPQQSIYLFRGSRSKVFFEQQEKFKNQNQEVLFLQNNFRSQSRLLEFFNELFPQMSSDFSTMKAQKEAIQGQKAMILSHFPEGTEESEIHQLTLQLKTLLDQGVNPKEIGILLRKRSQIDKLQKRLTALGFPVISHSSGNFFSRRETLDGLGLLKFLLNPWDNENLVLLLRSPWLEMREESIVSLIQNSEGAYWPTFKEYFQETQGPGKYLLEALEDAESFGYVWTFRRLLVNLKLFDYCHYVDSTGRREANLWKLVNLVEKLAREPGGSLAEFVKRSSMTKSLDQVGESGDALSANEPNKINLMTVHASKGLQFDYVFLPFLQKRKNPTTFQEFSFYEEKAKWDMRVPLQKFDEFKGSFLEYLQIQQLKKWEDEEDLRVLYVAMTRAKNQLYLSWAGKVEKGSWAESLQAFKESWNQNSDVEIFEQAPEEALAYSLKEESSKPRGPFKVSSAPSVEIEKPEPATPPKDWARLVQTQNFRRRGVVLHRVFEASKYHPRERLFELANDWLPDEKTAIEKAIDFVLDHTEVPFTEIIKSGEVEWAFVDGKKDDRSEGRIDLWGVHNNHLWIVDYKTGNPKYQDKAFDQMSAYAEVLKKHLNWQGEIKLCAVFPFSEETFTRSF